MPHWIWYPGDFEIRHALKLNCRREQRDYQWPAYWKMDDCWKNVRFRKTAVLDAPGRVRALARGVGHLAVDGKRHPFGAWVPVDPGAHTVEVICARPEGLPCAYVEGAPFDSGEGWLADHLVNQWVPAGFSGMYDSPEDDPEEFKFQYERIAPVSCRDVQGGTLWDFGRETFAKLIFENIRPGEALPVYYGESEREALDTAFCYLTGCVPEGVTQCTLPARAFRYVFVPDTERKYALSADYESLPLPFRGAFRCSDETLNRIWDAAAYTFHLNSREFFLDGIKRDRWIWSGDAYQSDLVSYYLFNDRDIVKRTMIALRGKDPVEQHLNTILDYSLFWIIAVGDYHRFAGDLEFVRFIWPRLKSLLQYCLDQRNRDGFLAGRPGDWVFIDWADIDKTGAVCAEQMLLCRALEAAARCATLLGEDGEGYMAEAMRLRAATDAAFWRKDKQAYIDSFESGREHVTRHANLLAILFGYADGERRRAILEAVVDNDEVPQITTPYFKFFELEALCATGRTEAALQAMRAYWGGMLDLGATTIWEEYDPRMQGDEHYAMYGGKYHKSLCHAWGASPIYLLGRYFLGVSPTSDGYETFDCAPDPASLSWMEGTVPAGDGSVKVIFRNGDLRVWTDRPGGALVWKGERIPLTPNVETVIRA